MKLLGRAQVAVDLIGGMQCFSQSAVYEPVCIGAKSYMDEAALKQRSEAVVTQKNTLEQLLAVLTADKSATEKALADCRTATADSAAQIKSLADPLISAQSLYKKVTDNIAALDVLIADLTAQKGKHDQSV